MNYLISVAIGEKKIKVNPNFNIRSWSPNKSLLMHTLILKSEFYLKF